jgi:hypothetical protein
VLRVCWILIALVFTFGYEVLQEELQYLALDDLQSSVDQQLTSCEYDDKREN